jgi:hypothetical protein
MVRFTRCCAVGPEDACNLSLVVPPRPFWHEVCQLSIDFLLPPFGALAVWALIAVGQMPGYILSVFLALLSVCIMK